MAQSINFGYMRVSSKEQNLDRQLEALKPYVTSERYIFKDKASGKDMEREGFQDMFDRITTGDTLYIKSIDRLGRNKDQIQEYLRKFKEKGVRVKIIDLPTTMQDMPQENEWVVDMMNNIIIEVYTSMAEKEREDIRQRQKEGIAAAKSKGRTLGRPVVELPREWNKLYKQWKAGEITAVAFMKAINMKKATFYNKVKEFEKGDGVTLKHYQKRYEVIMQGTFPKNRKDLMFASLMTEMESTFNIPMQKNPEWEKQNVEIISLYRQVSNSRTL